MLIQHVPTQVRSQPGVRHEADRGWYAVCCVKRGRYQNGSVRSVRTGPPLLCGGAVPSWVPDTPPQPLSALPRPLARLLRSVIFLLSSYCLPSNTMACDMMMYSLLVDDSAFMYLKCQSWFYEVIGGVPPVFCRSSQQIGLCDSGKMWHNAGEPSPNLSLVSAVSEEINHILIYKIYRIKQSNENTF